MTEAENNYQQMAAKTKKKMMKYRNHLIKKFPDVAIINIQEKVEKKFNVKFVR